MSAVAVVGAGLIGSAVARRLVAAGLEVAAYDVAPEKVAALEPLGIRPLRSLAEAAELTDRAVLAVFDIAQVADVLVAEGALAERWAERGAAPVVVVVSTCGPDAIRRVGARAHALGTAVVECPLSGSSGQVAAGAAVGLVAGDPAAVAAVAAILDAIAPTRHVLGPLGDGAKAKLATNLILGLNRAALAEGLVFAGRLGLDPAAFLAIARTSAAYSSVMDVKGGKMLSGDFSAEGRMVQTHKDFRLIIGAAQAEGQALTLGEVYLDLVGGCLEHGEGELDNSAVIREIARRTGPPEAAADTPSHPADGDRRWPT